MGQTRTGSLLKVLVADGHWIVRMGLKEVFRQLDGDFQIIEASDCDNVLSLIEQGDELDLVVIDLRLPGGDGFDLLRSVKNDLPDVPVVIVSASENRSDILRAVDLGALGYVPKSADGDDFKKALDLVLAGEVSLPRRLLEKPTERQPSARATAWSDAEQAQMEARLTNRQRQIYGLLSQGLTNADIAGRLGLSVNTVRVHIHGILQRLQLDNRMQVVLRAARKRSFAAEDGSHYDA